MRPIGEDLSLRGSQCRAPRAHVPLELPLFLILHLGRARSGSWLREQVVGILRRAPDPEVDQVVLLEVRGRPGLAILDHLRCLEQGWYRPPPGGLWPSIPARRWSADRGLGDLRVDRSRCAARTSARPSATWQDPAAARVGATLPGDTTGGVNPGCCRLGTVASAGHEVGQAGLCCQSHLGVRGEGEALAALGELDGLSVPVVHSAMSAAVPWAQACRPLWSACSAQVRSARTWAIA